jgi:hypothetical protein
MLRNEVVLLRYRPSLTHVAQVRCFEESRAGMPGLSTILLGWAGTVCSVFSPLLTSTVLGDTLSKPIEGCRLSEIDRQHGKRYKFR